MLKSFSHCSATMHQRKENSQEPEFDLFSTLVLAWPRLQQFADHMPTGAMLPTHDVKLCVGSATFFRSLICAVCNCGKLSRARAWSLVNSCSSMTQTYAICWSYVCNAAYTWYLICAVCGGNKIAYIILIYGLRKLLIWVLRKKGLKKSSKFPSWANIPLGMVPASLPVDCYRAFPFVQHLGSGQCASSNSRHAVKQVIKHGAIKAWEKRTFIIIL